MKVIISFQGFDPAVEMHLDVPDETSAEQYIKTILDLMINPGFHTVSWRVVTAPPRKQSTTKNSSVGRPLMTIERIPAKFKRIYPRYQNGELNICQIAKLCDISRPTVYKYIRILEKGDL